jgi:two-component system, LytTR family, response regulator LytT
MIINRKAIKAIEPYFNQRLVVHLTVKIPEPALVPRLKVAPFLSWIEKGG